MSAQTKTNSRWVILVIACLAQFMVVLDNTIVNVALPSIQKGLDFSPSNLQWVVNAYTLIFGGFLLLGGRAADLLGRRRLFVAGVALFASASLLNGLAQSSTMLILGRGLQGLGGALVSPAALSIIITTFQDRSERTRALGVWSAIAAGGAAFGLLLGGILTELISWRWNFFVNVPVGAMTIMLATRYVPESHADLGHRRFDAAGATTVTAGLLAIVFGIVKAQSWGWGSTKTLGVLAFGAILLAAFVLIESRSSAPLVKLSIFKIRSIATANGVMMLVASALFGMFFFVSLYAQDILHYSPLQAGLAFLPLSLGIVIGAGISQAIIPRIGIRNVSVIGLVLATLGVLVMTRVPVDGVYVTNLLVAFVPMSIGIGLVFVPLTLLGTSGVSNDDAGLASGLFNSSQQVGGSLGLAILATLSVDHTNSLIKSGVSVTQATVSGYHVAFLAAAIMMAAGASLLVLLLRKRHLEGLEFDPAALAGRQRERLPQMRKDAERNRQRVLEAADAMFRERGVEVSVGEIADAAGVGRGTLFRNFKSKDDLIAAVFVERLGEVLNYGRELLVDDPDDAEVTFTFVAGLVQRQEENRALIQAATDDMFTSVTGLQQAHAALLELIGALMARGKRSGAIRPEATPTDLMMLIKGLCMYAPANVPLPAETIQRHLDLVRAAMTTPQYSRPLTGEPAPLPV